MMIEIEQNIIHKVSFSPPKCPKVFFRSKHQSHTPAYAG